MCLMWRVRQRKLGIDDFGNPLEPQESSSPPLLDSDPDSPVEVVRGPDEGVPVQQAVETAVESDVRTPEDGEDGAGEQTPLLKRNGKNGKNGKSGGIRKWLRL